jgi:hypothetical protein
MERTFANYCSQGLLINAQLLYNEENKTLGIVPYAQGDQGPEWSEGTKDGDRRSS